MAKKLEVPFKKAVQAHLTWCRASNYSRNTINDYQNTFNYALDYFNADKNIRDIKRLDIEGFMEHMRNQPISNCKGATGHTHGTERYRSAKTLRNYHIGLSSLWSWALKRGYVDEHVLQATKPPRVHQAEIQPLPAADVVALLRACNMTRPYKNKPLSHNSRPTARRDKAIIALFVDTAIRCTELCSLVVSDVKFMANGGEVQILNGKGGKSRWVPFRRRCANYLQEWLLERGEYHNEDSLFVYLGRNDGHKMTRTAVSRIIRRLGKKINVAVSPHLLRTTAACLMVQNGMTAWQLQRIMGHSDITTTMRYVRAATIDIHQAMATASPLDNLRL